MCLVVLLYPGREQALYRREAPTCWRKSDDKDIARGFLVSGKIAALSGERGYKRQLLRP